MSDLPKPLVPADVDLRGVPIPREAFAQMAVLQFGVTIEEARALVHEVVGKVEGKRSRKSRRIRK